jgi:two-component system response regulator AtoC
MAPPSDIDTAGLRVGVEHAFIPALSAAMRVVERTLGDIADTDIPVLIEGESGTGKGAVARRIHQLSSRSQEPMLKISCATLTPAFFSDDGRVSDGGKKPWHGAGTIFLDEVGELDAACQPKLLYSLPDEQDRNRNRRAVRLISCTARILEQEMRCGRLREDLYYRLNGVCLRLPPLRQRREDIPALIQHFLSRYATLFARRKPDLSPAAMKVLMEYSWPGNIRELEYSMQRIVALGDYQMALAELQATPKEAADNGNGGVSLKQVARTASRQAERDLILKVLSQTRWNRKRAAQELHISYKALLYKMKQIGLNSADS